MQPWLMCFDTDSRSTSHRGTKYSLAGDHLFNTRGQFRQTRVLSDKSIGSRMDCPKKRIVIVEGGDQNHGSFDAAPANSLENVPSRLSGKADIHEDHVRGGCQNRPDRFPRIETGPVCASVTTAKRARRKPPHRNQKNRGLRKTMYVPYERSTRSGSAISYRLPSI